MIFRPFVIGITCLGLVSACGKKEDKEDTGSNEESSGSTSQSSGSSNIGAFPSVQAISLDGVGENSGLSLSGGSECDNMPDMGVMGLALGAACHTSPMAANLLLGSKDGDHNGDGRTDCNDLAAGEAGEGAGILMHLLCEDFLQENDNITSLAFEGDDDAIAISFEKMSESSDATGSWSAGREGSFPADIRIWNSEDTLANLQGAIVINLETKDKGRVRIRNLDEGVSNPDLDMDIQFSTASSTANCASDPSSSHCHYQEIRIYNGEAAVTDGPPNGFNLRIFTDSKTNPQFYALEGKYRYTAATAAQAFAEPDLQATRTIYFQFLQTNGQMWGAFHFLDENGDLLSWNPGAGDILAPLAAGQCQEFGSENWVTCDLSKFDPENPAYTALWQGKDNMEQVTQSLVSESELFPASSVPEAGLCDTSGSCFGGE